MRHSAPVVVPRHEVIIFRSCPILNEGAGAIIDEAITFDPARKKMEVTETELAMLVEEHNKGKEPPDEYAAAEAADKKGAGQNSDNHGANAGRNVLIGVGTIEFRDSAINLLGTDANGKALQDDDIFSLNSTIPRKLDGYIRQ